MGYTSLQLAGGLFLCCLIMTAGMTPVVIRLARRVGAVDRGGYRKVFRGEMPLLGGIAIATPLILLGMGLGTAGHIIISNWKWLWIHHRNLFDLLYSLATSRNECLTLAIGGIAIVALGLVDDTKGIRARWKLLGQIGIALFACFTGHILTSVSVPLVGPVNLGVGLGMLMTVVWVVGLINALNLIDGIDGLASGIALVGAVALVTLSVVQENTFVTLAGAALAGSLLAFLFYNFPPAKVFLGDTGSMFLGFALAMLSLRGAQKSEAAVIILAPILALSLPIFETLVSMVRRYVGGVPIFAGDNQHTHHRLLRRGYSQPRVVLTLCGTGLVFAIAAIMSALVPEYSRWAWCSYAVYLGALINLAWLAGYLHPANFKAVLERRRRNTIFQALGRYASLRLNAGMQPAESSLLLELCRQELGLSHLEVTLRSGARLMASPAGIHYCSPEGPFEELFVKSTDGQDILVAYAFNGVPDANSHQDVCACLAGIFDGIRICLASEPQAGVVVQPQEGYSAEDVDFQTRRGSQK